MYFCYWVGTGSTPPVIRVSPDVMNAFENHGFRFLGPSNDVWIFHVPSGAWTWIGGRDGPLIDEYGAPVVEDGVYGTLNVPSLTNMPGSRYAHQIVLRDGSESAPPALYLFAGQVSGTPSFQ